MTKKIARQKKRNPQDTTLRNIRALKERVRLLETRMFILELDVTKLQRIKK